MRRAREKEKQCRRKNDSCKTVYNENNIRESVTSFPPFHVRMKSLISFYFSIFCVFCLRLLCFSFYAVNMESKDFLSFSLLFMYQNGY